MTWHGPRRMYHTYSHRWRFVEPAYAFIGANTLPPLPYLIFGGGGESGVPDPPGIMPSNLLSAEYVSGDPPCWPKSREPFFYLRKSKELLQNFLVTYERKTPHVKWLLIRGPKQQYLIQLSLIVQWGEQCVPCTWISTCHYPRLSANVPRAMTS